MPLLRLSYNEVRIFQGVAAFAMTLVCVLVIAMAYYVFGILTVRVIPQIFWSVIELVAVTVADNIIFGTLPYKRGCDKSMDHYHSPTIVPAKANCRVSYRHELFKNFPFVESRFGVTLMMDIPI